VKVFCTFFLAETRTHHRRRRHTKQTVGTGHARQDSKIQNVAGNKYWT
jgi:hypothetical protein